MGDVNMDELEEKRFEELQRMIDDDNYTMTTEEYEDYYRLLFIAQEETEQDFLREAQW